MNILFLTIGRINNIETRSLYPDLLRQFRDAGHKVYIVYPAERRENQDTAVFSDNGAERLCVKIGNITKCNMIEKGISTLMIGSSFKAAIKKHFKGVKFDLILYSTPPITFTGVIKYLKKRDNAKTYLLLKDIFPQNSVDLNMLTTGGVKGLIYRYFRQQERQLYAISDTIGCMSQANCDYVLKHNPETDPAKVEICPNCIDPQDMSIGAEEKVVMREKYGIPNDKVVFIYGGNLGKPQDVPFIIKAFKACSDIENAFFVVAGSGTDRKYLEEYVNNEKPANVKLFGQLPKEEYDKMVACCDVGLIFLDHRFTIPNFPSRLLSYMQAKLSVLACTDANTDVGKIIEEGGFGWWCESTDTDGFKEKVRNACDANNAELGEKGNAYLLENYSAERGYKIIMNKKDI